MPSGVLLQDHETEMPKLLKSEAVVDGIERLRRRCRELKADQHRIASAPYPSSYAKAQMRAQIEALAMQGAPSVSRLVELDGPVDFQTQRLRSEAFGAETPVLVFGEVPDTIALVAWLHRDLLIKRLDAEIDAEADDASSIDREVRAAEAEADLLATERDICSLIWRGQAEGLPVEFPADTNPVALLWITLITPPRADGLPPTSAGHSCGLRRHDPNRDGAIRPVSIRRVRAGMSADAASQPAPTGVNESAHHSAQADQA